jgi:hypothetical protein
MRIARNIFIILGVLLIILNLLGYLAGAKPFPEDTTQNVNIIAYFIGANMLIICGCVFLLFANKLNKRIKRKKEKALVDSLLSDQTESSEKKT